MDEERLLSYHRFTREHGVNRPLYLLARLVLVPFFLLYFRLSRIGREHGKVKGPLIVASNHRSFLDPFVIGASLPWRRPLHYVAKVELFEKGVGDLVLGVEVPEAVQEEAHPPSPETCSPPSTRMIVPLIQAASSVESR